MRNDDAESEDPEVQYVWSRRYIDAPVLRDENKDADDDCFDGSDERLYYTTDANMNVTALLDTGGDAVERYSCDPYGRVTIYDDDWSDTRSASSYDNAVLYCGYFFDNETGLYCVRYRFYDPPLGRWLQRDPIGYIDSANTYLFAQSAPLHHCDWSGAAPASTARMPPTSVDYGLVSISKEGKRYDAASDSLEDSSWDQIAPGTPKQCPSGLTLPGVVEHKLSQALSMTLKYKVEYGGAISFESGNILVWGPVRGDATRVVSRDAAPPSLRKNLWGTYHTHPPRRGLEGMPPWRETRFSPGDIQSWWENEVLMVVRGCRCTLAILKTSAWTETPQEDLEDFSDAIDDYTEGPGFDEYLKEPTLQERWNKHEKLVRDKHRVFGKAARKAGVCYYRKCGPGPNKGQQKLDLVGAK